MICSIITVSNIGKRKLIDSSYIKNNERSSSGWSIYWSVKFTLCMSYEILEEKKMDRFVFKREREEMTIMEAASNFDEGKLIY